MNIDCSLETHNKLQIWRGEKSSEFFSVFMLLSGKRGMSEDENYYKQRVSNHPLEGFAV